MTVARVEKSFGQHAVVRQARGAKLEAAISEGGDGLTVSINWSQDGMRAGWAEYLGRRIATLKCVLDIS